MEDNRVKLLGYGTRGFQRRARYMLMEPEPFEIAFEGIRAKILSGVIPTLISAQSYPNERVWRSVPLNATTLIRLTLLVPFMVIFLHAVEDNRQVSFREPDDGSVAVSIGKPFRGS